MNKTSFDNICVLKYNITEKLSPPIYLYYELDNFYLNHRSMVMSKSWEQLRGEVDVVKNKILISERIIVLIINAMVLSIYGKFSIMIPQNTKAILVFL